MSKSKEVFSTMLLILVATIALNQSYGIISNADNIAKMQFLNNATNAVNGSFSKVQTGNMTLVNGTEEIMFYNKTNVTSTPPPTPIEICGDGIDNDGDGLVDEGCPILPPTVPDKPTVDINQSKIVRACAVGDVDNNNGLVTQVNLAKKYNCEVFVLPGDFAYSSASGVKTKLADGGFTKDNTVLANGNHDSCSFVTSFTGMANCYGLFNLSNSRVNSFVSFITIDANSAFGCTSSQFNTVKSKMESSDAWYNVVVVHQPFVTAPSKHGVNGQFDCYNPLFKANGVKLVMQAHNHNYQRFNINGMIYGTYGTGTHDTGSSMYSFSGNAWKNFDCLKCITKINGITVFDFKIDDPAKRNINAWFLDNSGNVQDKFGVN